MTIWTTGKAWRIQTAADAPRDLEPGTRFEVRGHPFEVVLLGLAQAGGEATRHEGSLYEPISLTTMFDAVRIERNGVPVLNLSGIPARILSEISEIGQPVSWEAVARELWDGSDRAGLRRKWDLALGRLRKKLRDAGLRQDLLVPDGSGNVVLQLYPGDTCRVRS